MGTKRQYTIHILWKYKYPATKAYHGNSRLDSSRGPYKVAGADTNRGQQKRFRRVGIDDPRSWQLLCESEKFGEKNKEKRT